MKKQSNLSQLMGYAGNHKYLTYLSLVLSAVSAVLTLFPFVFLFFIIREVIEVAPNFSHQRKKRKRKIRITENASELFTTKTTDFSRNQRLCGLRCKNVFLVLKKRKSKETVIRPAGERPVPAAFGCLGCRGRI